MAQTIAQLKQTRLLIRFHCNQMINLRGIKKCYPCMEFKQRELNNEYSWLTCFLIINQDLPTTDIWTPPPPPSPPFRPSSYIKRSKAGDCVQSQLTKFSRWRTAHWFIMKAPNPLGMVSLLSLPLVMGIAMFFVGNFLESFWFLAIWRALRKLDDYVIRFVSLDRFKRRTFHVLNSIY